MAGVPQASVRGPTLYLIFTADLTTNDKVLTSTFADDTAILSSHKNTVIASVELNDHLKCMVIWSNKSLKVSMSHSHYEKQTVRRCFLIILKLSMKARQIILGFT